MVGRSSAPPRKWDDVARQRVLSGRLGNNLHRGDQGLDGEFPGLDGGGVLGPARRVKEFSNGVKSGRCFGLQLLGGRLVGGSNLSIHGGIPFC